MPYLHHQGWEMGQILEIFMPIYEGNLLNLLAQLRYKKAPPEIMQAMTDRMLCQILLALDHVHARGIIHRDIKPANILHQGNNFLLTDFGIAKAADTSRTIVGTDWYMAPEVREKGEQTPKINIYSLGVTIVECLEELRPEAERPQWQQWHRDLQTYLSHLKPGIVPMLANVADQRPTARQLLQNFHQPLSVSQSPQTNMALSNSSPFTNQANGITTFYFAAPTAMDWTRTGATAIYIRSSRPP